MSLLFGIIASSAAFASGSLPPPPMPTGVPTAAESGTVRLGALLDGKKEPAGGDQDGWGTYFAELRPDAGALCYTLIATKIQIVNRASIHSAPMGRTGPALVRLNVTGPQGEVCVAAAPALLRAMAANPAAYYVNLHNPQFPGGAIRGQLELKQ